MVSLSEALTYYKRKEIQKAILDSAKDREVVAQFGAGFGKRPDILSYENDVMEQVKNGATSFHVSEEIWKNPLQLEPTLSRKDLDKIRKGWDLVLDIDCKDWEFSKLTTYLFIKSLKEHDIKNISCKFSGNKGFHIGVPSESFPDDLDNEKIKDIFPEGPRKIAKYLLHLISHKYVKVKDNKVFFDKNSSLDLIELKKKFGDKEFIIRKCSSCNKKIDAGKKNINDFECVICGKKVRSSQSFMACEKCNNVMNKTEITTGNCECGSKDYIDLFNPLSIIEVDTILISSRHLYRMSYSFNEKSGLVSVPINPDKVLEFNKLIAKPENVRVSKFKFLDIDGIAAGEAKKLIVEAFDYEEKKEEIEIKKEFKYEELKEALPEEFFPPCIKLVLEGLDDGKKRALFILVNFFTSVGWSYEKIEERLKEWNKKNKEQLREVYLVGQLRYHKTHKSKVLPPNCSNKTS